MSNRIERMPPQNREAEEAVLGSLLIDPDAALRVATILSPGDFYQEKHGHIFEAVMKLHDDREPIDFLTVCDELERRNRLDGVGGPAYIMGLINAVPTSIHAEHYAEIVARMATRRRTIAAASKIAVLAYDDSIEVPDMLDEVEQTIFGVTAGVEKNDVRSLHQLASGFYDRIEYLAKHKGMVGLPTGYVDLDKILGGMQPTDFLILAARPSVGKTALALNIAANVARIYNARVAVFSLEMSGEQIIQRFVSQETGIESQRLRQGDLHDDEWPALMRATGDVSDWPVIVDDTPGISATELRAKARRVSAEMGLDLIIVDYLQLMRGRGENRVQEVSAISRDLKGLARELKVPVLALSQLSRKLEERIDKRPILSDLRESGSIEQDADVVMFIYRDELYNEATEHRNIAEVIVAKHRNGPTGTVSLFFQKDSTRFLNAEVRRSSLEEPAWNEPEPIDAW